MALSRPKRGFESRWGRTSLAFAQSVRSQRASGSAATRFARRQRFRIPPSLVVQAKAPPPKLPPLVDSDQHGGSGGGLRGPSTRASAGQARLLSLRRPRFTLHANFRVVAASGDSVAGRLHMESINRFVYLLRSRTDETAHYVGITNDVSRRLAEHNRGTSFHTSRGGPWQLVVSIEFANSEGAAHFERYLKTGSGRAFAKRHFV